MAGALLGRRHLCPLRPMVTPLPSFLPLSFIPSSLCLPSGPLLSGALLQGSLEDDKDKSEGRLLHLWRGFPGARRGTTLPPEALCPPHPEPIFAKMQTSQALLAQQERICLQYCRPGFDPWVGRIPLEEEMATQSSNLAWKIPRTEEPGGLQSVGSQSDRME